MAKDAFEKTKDFVDEKIGKAREYLEKDLVDDVKEGWRGVSKKVGDFEWDELSSDLRKTVKANPIISVAVAAGVGLLVGLLLGRRDD
jgi:ElaB/YqjD/DUF883 family membrane-anchored ribosome-binding protein